MDLHVQTQPAKRFEPSGDVQAPVGIVGAGPVALFLALRLAEFGIRSVVFELEPGLIKRGSKACTIQGDVLEAFYKVDCATTLAREGIPWDVSNTYLKGKVLTTERFPKRLGFAPFVNISQHRTQEVLLNRINQDERLKVLYSHRVVGVAQDEDGVTLDVSSPAGKQQMRFRYVVACDGIHSTVRALTNVPWIGYSHSDRFLSLDIKAVLPFTHERHFHFDHPANPGRQVVMHAQPDNVWRVDWQLAPDVEVEAEKQGSRLDRRIRNTIGDVPYEIVWLSTYRFNQKIVDKMRLGRILFAGDAAHVLPPYGARGMNSGIQDADNLAWKLAMVLNGLSSEELLDTYHAERHAAAKQNLRITEATIRFMAPSSGIRQWLRNQVLNLARPFMYFRGHVNSGRMAEPHAYIDSPIIRFDDKNDLIGQFAPDMSVVCDGRRARLREQLGNDFVALCFGKDLNSVKQFAEGLSMQSSAIPLKVFLVLPSQIRIAELPPGVSVLYVNEFDIPRIYSVKTPTWFLIRPDGHIAAAGDCSRATELHETLMRSCCANTKEMVNQHRQ